MKNERITAVICLTYCIRQTYQCNECVDLCIELFNLFKYAFKGLRKAISDLLVTVNTTDAINTLRRQCFLIKLFLTCTPQLERAALGRSVNG